MPPTDPRLRPRLERALPADRVPGTTQVLDWPEIWDVEFGSGEWRSVHVRARAQDRQGREVLDVENYVAGGTWLDSLVADPSRMRERG